MKHWIAFAAASLAGMSGVAVSTAVAARNISAASK